MNRFPEQVKPFNSYLTFNPLLNAQETLPDAHPVEQEELAMRLAHFNVREFQNELMLRDDMYDGISFEHSIKVFERIGFEQVHEYPVLFDADEERFVILWHSEKGILATISSIEERLGESYIWYNWTPHDAASFKRHVDGGEGVQLEDGRISWLGYEQADFGVENTIGTMSDEGEFLTEWAAPQVIYLVDRRVHNSLNEQDILEELPDYVRQAIKR